MRRILKITSKVKSHMAYRDIVVSLSVNERRKWESDFIQATLKKLAHMGYGEIQGGSKGVIYFTKIKILGVICSPFWRTEHTRLILQIPYNI